MQFRMTADGAIITGTIKMASKKKLLDIKGDYKAVFKVEGTLNTKLHKDVFDRYLVNVGKEIAAKWLKYESEAIKQFQKKLDKEEQNIEKQAKNASQSEVIALVERRKAEITWQAEEEFKQQMDKFVGQGHSAAMKAMDKTAKAVLKDRKALVLKALKIVVGLAVVVGTTVVAAPVGAIAIATAVITCVSAAAKAASDGAALSKEFIGNYKSYAKSMESLDKQMGDTIKFARACEAKLDALEIKRALVEQQIDRIKKEDPKKAFHSSEIDTLQKQVDALNKSVERMKKYDAADVEKKLTDARGMIKSLLAEPIPDHAGTASKVLDKVVTVCGLALKGLKKLSKAAA